MTLNILHSQPVGYCQTFIEFSVDLQSHVVQRLLGLEGSNGYKDIATKIWPFKLANVDLYMCHTLRVKQFLFSYSFSALYSQ